MAESATRTTVVGTRARRLDADDKVTGRARYATIFSLPGMLHGKIVRSDRPHARIVRIDTSAAERSPASKPSSPRPHGGRSVRRDRQRHDPLRRRPRSLSSATRSPPSPPKQKSIAELAAQLIEVDYEDLPAVFDPHAAMQSDAPLIHDDVAAYAGPATSDPVRQRLRPDHAAARAISSARWAEADHDRHGHLHCPFRPPGSDGAARRARRDRCPRPADGPRQHAISVRRPRSIASRRSISPTARSASSRRRSAAALAPRLHAHARSLRRACSPAKRATPGAPRQHARRRSQFRQSAPPDGHPPPLRHRRRWHDPRPRSRPRSWTPAPTRRPVRSWPASRRCSRRAPIASRI